MKRIAIGSMLLLTILLGSASAGRLGGAYRGPEPKAVVPPNAVGPGGFKGALAAIRACWPHYYEHNKEWMLADRLRARRREARGGSLSPPDAWVEGVLPLFVKAAEDPAAEIRDAAVLALGKTGREDAVPTLLARLDDPDREIREDALLALGLVGDAKAIGHLRTQLSRDWDSDDLFRPGDPKQKPHAEWAALGLALAGDREGLVDLYLEYEMALADERPAAKATAMATAIGHLLSEPGLVEDLAIELKRDPAPVYPVRVGICHALGVADLAACRPWLHGALLCGSREVRAAAVLALEAPRTMEEWNMLAGKWGLKSTGMVSLYAIHSVAEADHLLEPVLDDLVGMATKPQKNRYQFQHAAFALARAGHAEANEFHLEHLEAAKRKKFTQEDDSAMAMALGLTGDRLGRTSLEEILSDREYDPELRGYCALALALMESRESLPVIRAALEGNADQPYLAIQGAWALGLMGDASDVPHLLSVLEREDASWRQARGAAAVALGLISDVATSDHLVGLVEKSEDALTRAFAIVALGWMIDRDPVPRIPLLFKKFNYRVDSPVFREVMSCL